jgi:hypothetical protein
VVLALEAGEVHQAARVTHEAGHRFARSQLIKSSIFVLQTQKKFVHNISEFSMNP